MAYRSSGISPECGGDPGSCGDTGELLGAPGATVPISALLPSDSPRSGGESMEHVQLLAEMATELPPIVVRRSTMRVIDGMHRLRAAELNNEDRVRVRFFDGTQEAAFVEAVKLNTAHGLPLSRAERVSAVTRIIASHPQWSDRRIAEATGLAASSVAAVRSRSTAPAEQLKKRVGRDGRARPLDAAEGRVRASHVIAANPGSTLREIAEQAGISVATAKDVRDRIRTGQDPLPGRQRGSTKRAEQTSSPVGMPTGHGSGSAEFPAFDLRSAWERLLRDPAMRTDSGRVILQLLRSHVVRDEETWHRLAAGVPDHRATTMARAAKMCAEHWLRFAQQLETVHVE